MTFTMRGTKMPSMLLKASNRAEILILSSGAVQSLIHSLRANTPNSQMPSSIVLPRFQAFPCFPYIRQAAHDQFLTTWNTATRGANWCLNSSSTMNKSQEHEALTDYVSLKQAARDSGKPTGIRIARAPSEEAWRSQNRHRQKSWNGWRPREQAQAPSQVQRRISIITVAVQIITQRILKSCH